MSRRCLYASFASVFLAALAVCGVHAQGIDWIASEQGIAVTHAPGSSRLDGMGGLSICVPDEFNKLDLYYYGGNLAAFLSESDTRSWDFWNRSSNRLDDSFDAAGVREQRIKLDSAEYGGRMAWRRNENLLLGLDYSYDMITNSNGPLDDSKIRGPYYGAFAGKRIGRFTLGGSAHLKGDNQDLTTSDVFAIRHQSSGADFQGAISMHAGPFGIGAQTERQMNTISGHSRDESRFHDDSFTWKRPLEAYDGALVWSPSDAVRGAFRMRTERIDGRQDVQVSWSDRMPQNPGRENVLLRVGTFAEKVRTFQTGTRWEIRPAESVVFAAQGDIARIDTKVDEGFNFKGSRRAEDSKERITQGGAGLSWENGSRRFRIGTEGWYLRDSNEDVLSATKVVARTLELRTGAEYFISDLLALRGGYVLSSVDQDLDLPRTLGIGNGFTIGAGFLPKGGLYRIDAALQMQKVLPDYEGNPRSESRRTSFSVGARFLL